MIRGTTPTHIFKIPFDTANLKEVRIFYAQNKKVIVEKTTENCVMEENKITVKLTQEETLRFSHMKNTEIQLKVMTTDGTVMATHPLQVHVCEILKDEVLV